MLSLSSILEETVFRGLMLHALITRLKCHPFVSALLSSAIFGISHIANERSLVQRCIYAAWTFLGGLIFGSAYLGTQGGLLLPILLHFFNNAIVAAICTKKVAMKLVEERDALRAVAVRVQHERTMIDSYPFIVLKDAVGTAQL